MIMQRLLAIQRANRRIQKQHQNKNSQEQAAASTPKTAKKIATPVLNINLKDFNLTPLSFQERIHSQRICLAGDNRALENSQQQLKSARSNINRKLSLMKAKNNKIKLSFIFNRTKTDMEHNFIGKKYINQVSQQKNIQNYFIESKNKLMGELTKTKYSQKRNNFKSVLPICTKAHLLSLSQLQQQQFRDSQPRLNSKNMIKRFVKYRSQEKTNHGVDLQQSQGKPNDLSNKRKLLNQKYSESNKLLVTNQFNNQINDSIDLSPWKYAHFGHIKFQSEEI